ncbi:NAD/NADP octopine/nopaline dehydrogenase family protein [uncultured Roseobacter sp.]|uniref:NAD/NADP octopine/nopaline dehydrogenase family protein n=1 Tax=uncultured Roseobacter sp. TaxID=114847 RepID=UPI0026089F61|nr:NAD/NADP octopine/nopaline dehydrogenase family protein [uncultured Roseobacter sp.]
MRIAILGTGGIALGYAAMLSKGGHEVVLFSLSGEGGVCLRGKTIKSTGPIEHSFKLEIADNLELALQHAAAVIIATTANYHRPLIDLLVPALSEGQHVLVSAELSLSGSMLADQLCQSGKAVPVTSLGTTLLTARRAGKSEVVIGIVRNACQAATEPASKQGVEIAFWRKVFGPVLEPAPARLWITFSNLNPTVHAANALCNFTRIENGESWSNYAGITSSVANLIEAFDCERLSVAKAYGVHVVSLKDHYHTSFGFPHGMPLAEMTSALHEKRKGRPRGPTSIETRYITEDIPYGFVFIEYLGKQKAVATPLHTAAIDLFSALYRRSFRIENPFIDNDLHNVLLPNPALS